MSYVSKFKTDTAYSNADINQIIQAITGSGVLPSSPNEILSSVSNDGVTYTDERCFVSWANEDKTQVKIGSGTVIMSDGSYIVINDEILSVPSGDEAFVYIYQDLFLHNIPLCENTLPDNENSYILLAQIKDGVIMDKRKYAYAKLGLFGTRPITQTQVSITTDIDVIPSDTPFASIEVPNVYSKVIIYNVKYGFFGLFDLTKNVFELTFLKSEDVLKTNQATLKTKMRLNDIYIRYIDGFLNFYSTDVLSSLVTVTHDLSVIIF